MTSPSAEELAFYAQPAPMTALGEHEAACAELPTDVAGLCGAVQGLLMHPFHAHRYGIALRPETEQELQNRSVREMLSSVRALDDRPLGEPRPPERRAAGNCRHFATLLTGLLRARGVPARARCGFGAYFTPERYEDHWICECWSAEQGRWVLADPQIDAIQREGMGIRPDTLDLGREDFWVAGQAWQRCREGQNDPLHFGIMNMWGLWFIRGNLLRDLASLRKIELLPWDDWGLASAEETELDEESWALLDEAAAACGAVPPDWTHLADLAQHEGLRVPREIFTFRPTPHSVDLGELVCSA